MLMNDMHPLTEKPQGLIIFLFLMTLHYYVMIMNVRSMISRRMCPMR
jgi:hypothetical protein